MKTFVLMIQFLTTIPININLKVDIEDFTKGIKYFALVGAVVGALMLIPLELLKDMFSPILLAGVVLVLEILLTGGLHLDGLADSSDGMFSNRHKDKILEIMKDSRIGSNGALALILLIVFKLLLLSEIIGENYFAVIVLAPVIARGVMSIVFKYSVYARKEGMGNFFIGKGKLSYIIVNMLVILVTAYLLESVVLCVLLTIITIILNLIVVKFFTKMIDGITGDNIGFLIEVDEVFILFIGLIILKVISELGIVFFSFSY